MEKRDKQLYVASMRGDTDSLNELLKEDKFILNNYGSSTAICYNETPLHIAASQGQMDFAKVLLQHKPNLVNEPDSRHRYPLHLASANGHKDMVKLLLSVDTDSCLIEDEFRRTPLHLAMVKSQVEVVNELVRARPEAIICPSNHMKGITILHSYVIRNGQKALEQLVGVDGRVLNTQDGEGNTILHKVISLKQLETLEYMVGISELVVNLKNQNGFTALDIIKHMPEDLNTIKMHELLANFGTSNAETIHHQHTTNTNITRSTQIENNHDINPMSVMIESARDKMLFSHTIESRVEKKRNVLLICATVIASMAYQAGINPPGGVWEEDTYLKDKNITVKAGTSIMAVNSPDNYDWFWGFNTASFISAISLALVLTGAPPRSGEIWLRILMQKAYMWLLTFITCVIATTMALTYLFAMMGTSPYIFDKHYWTPSGPPSYGPPSHGPPSGPSHGPPSGPSHGPPSPTLLPRGIDIPSVDDTGEMAYRPGSPWLRSILVLWFVLCCFFVVITVMLPKCIKRSSRSANLREQQAHNNANNNTYASV